MNILLLGSGGREHALAWKIAASPLLTKLYCAPGNAGIAREAECVALDIADHAAVIAFCKAQQASISSWSARRRRWSPASSTISRPPASRRSGRRKAAAQLEGSKGFTKDLCRRIRHPDRRLRALHAMPQPAKAYVARAGRADRRQGRRACRRQGRRRRETLAEAEAAIDMMFGGGFGAAGAEVVIEEFLDGEEATFFALCDGENALPLATAQDHKRVVRRRHGPEHRRHGRLFAGAGDDARDDRAARWTRSSSRRCARMQREGAPFKGVLFAGLMITDEGPKLIEYNVRFGDPECQVLMLRLKSDLVPALLAARDGQLKTFRSALVSTMPR